jgi:hypothetical protein
MLPQKEQGCLNDRTFISYPGNGIDLQNPPITDSCINFIPHRMTNIEFRKYLNDKKVLCLKLSVSTPMLRGEWNNSMIWSVVNPSQFAWLGYDIPRQQLRGRIKENSVPSRVAPWSGKNGRGRQFLWPSSFSEFLSILEFASSCN